METKESRRKNTEITVQKLSPEVFHTNYQKQTMKPDKSKSFVKNESNGKENAFLIAKLQNLSVGQKAYLFILFMGVLGAVVGGISAEIEIRGCITEHCLMVDITQKRLDGIGRGAFAGMGAAVFSSLPALLKGFRK